MTPETLIFWIIGLFIYFIPTAICIERKHPSRQAIVALNVFAGWTVLGWLVALIWALVPKGK